MANRRMFANSIINSARFLQMPATTRLLYYDLGMKADDDGFVESFSVLRMTNASEDDLRLLHQKGYIFIVNDELLVYICDWLVNNQIRKDRYSESIYKSLIPDILKTISECKPNATQIGNQSAPKTETSGCRSIVEDSIGKESRDKDSQVKKRSSSSRVSIQIPKQEETGFSDDMQSAFVDWLLYKTKERKQPYKEIGLRNLISTTKKNLALYGEAIVIDVISRSISAGYTGIVWDWCKKMKEEQDKQERLRREAESRLPF